jgi:hypothetical protein
LPVDASGEEPLRSHRFHRQKIMLAKLLRAAGTKYRSVISISNPRSSYIFPKRF